MRNTEETEFIAKACKRIAAKLRSKTSPQPMATKPLEQRKHTWDQSLIEKYSLCLAGGV